MLPAIAKVKWVKYLYVNTDKVFTFIFKLYFQNLVIKCYAQTTVPCCDLKYLIEIEKCFLGANPYPSHGGLRY